MSKRMLVTWTETVEQTAIIEVDDDFNPSECGWDESLLTGDGVDSQEYAVTERRVLDWEGLS